MTHEQLLRIYWAVNPEMIVTAQPVDKSSEPVTFVIQEVFQSKSGWTLFGVGGLPAEDIKPHLKPLSSITDEDAIAVAKMAFKEYGIPEPTTQITVKNVRDTEEGPVTEVVYRGTPKNSAYITTICHDYFMISFSEYEEWRGVCPNSHRVADYLRSKSYNLDFEPLNFIAI